MASVQPLLTFPQAAKMLNVPQASLRTVADEHGKTVQMGRAVRLHPEDLEELVSLCRVTQKARASTGGNEQTAQPSGKSATQAPAYRPAQTAAMLLKNSSRNTSARNNAQVVPLKPQN